MIKYIRSILALALVFGATLAASPVRAATTFTVTNTEDLVDVQPGDGSCNGVRYETFPGIPTPIPFLVGCTLRAAIMEANALPGADTITLPPGTYTLTHKGLEYGWDVAESIGDLDIKDDLTITGTGAKNTIIEAGTSSATSIGRVFQIESGVTAAIQNVTIRNGILLKDSWGDEGFGGGIANDGYLTLSHATISGNGVSFGGGGISNGDSSATVTILNSTITGNYSRWDGGGIANYGTLTLTNSTISGNSSDQGGGGIYSDQGVITIRNTTLSENYAKFGGGIYNQGRAYNNWATLTITNSTLSNNHANTNGGGIYNGTDDYLAKATIISSTIRGNIAEGSGGGVNNVATMTLANSTVSGNVAKKHGGGIFNRSEEGKGGLTITNSTISSNQSINSGGGIFNSGSLYNYVSNAPLTLINTTITRNIADSGNTDAGSGGGIFYFATDDKVKLRNTLIGDNTLAGDTNRKSDCFGTLTSQGYNLIEHTAQCIIEGNTTGNIIGRNPFLGDLANNGGPTRTHALRPPVQGPVFSFVGSPAINAGDPAGCTNAEGQPLSTDQRGVARPQNGRCDIGAFELVQTLVLPSGAPSNENQQLNAVPDATEKLDAAPDAAQEPSAVPEATEEPNAPESESSATPPDTLTTRIFIPTIAK